MGFEIQVKVQDLGSAEENGLVWINRITVASGSMHRTRLTKAGLIYVALALNSTKPAVHTKVSCMRGLKIVRGAHGMPPSLTMADSPARTADMEN